VIVSEPIASVPIVDSSQAAQYPARVLREQRLTFDEVAGLYDRVRPRYPAALVDDVVACAALDPGARILEIGCGTGKATVDFAARGFRMVCLEPGGNLARLARERLAGFANVEVVEQSFEAWRLEPESFDLVISAQAFHWVAADVRFVKTAAALRAGGSLAVFGHVPTPGSGGLRTAIDAAYATYAPTLAVEPARLNWYEDVSKRTAEFAASNLFGPVTTHRYAWSRAYGATDYRDLVRTYSEHRLLPPEQLEALVAAIHSAINAHGGTCTVSYRTYLYWAGRTG
jgi:SAM-dependent methyltransferase